MAEERFLFRRAAAGVLGFFERSTGFAPIHVCMFIFSNVFNVHMLCMCIYNMYVKNKFCDAYGSMEVCLGQQIGWAIDSLSID